MKSLTYSFVDNMCVALFICTAKYDIHNKTYCYKWVMAIFFIGLGLYTPQGRTSVQDLFVFLS